MTRALVKEVYLLNAFARTSSETSLLKSPTKRRNHSEKLKENERTSSHVSMTDSNPSREASDPPMSCLLLCEEQWYASHPWLLYHPHHPACQSWHQERRHSVERR